MQVMSVNLTFHDVNSRLIVAVVVVISWFALRERILGTPSGTTVLLEWLGLIALTMGLCLLKRRTPMLMTVPISISLSALMAGSIANTQESSALAQKIPLYWWGFGNRVMVAALILTLVAVGLLAFRGELLPQFGMRAKAIVGRLKTFLSLGVVGWTLPSILQPMDSWLNLGDATEKSLDELAGWVVGNIPGVHTSWVTHSLLGFPLLPLSFVSGSGNAKVVIVALYANFLVLLVPLLMGFVISRVVPQIGKLPAFAISLIVVSISGSPGNSSLFQELSFLARGFMPIALGALVVYAFGRETPALRWQAAVFGVLAGLTLMNNFEYGVGAGVAVLAIIAISSPTVPLAIRSVIEFLAGSVLSVFVVTIPSVIQRGDWMNRRLGVWADVLSGTGGKHSHNMGSWPPPFGLATLCFALGVVGVAVGITQIRQHTAFQHQRAAVVSSLYFGIWTVASAPYFLNGGAAGAFRTQFLFLPVALLAYSIFGVVSHGRVLASETQRRLKLTNRLRDASAQVPVVLLCALTVGSIFQVPNGLAEWRRVQTPAALDRNTDEWSPERLDWIRPSRVADLAAPYGGSESVGWWFSYGNAIEVLTGIENLLGTTGFETMRSAKQFALACEPLFESKKSFVVSIDGMSERLNACGIANVKALTSPNEDGLVVYEIRRE